MITFGHYHGLEVGIRGNSGFRNINQNKNSFLTHLIAQKNVANHSVYWRKISLVKTLLAEKFQLFPCLIDNIPKYEVFKYFFDFLLAKIFSNKSKQPFKVM